MDGVGCAQEPAGGESCAPADDGEKAADLRLGRGATLAGGGLRLAQLRLLPLGWRHG